MAETCIFTNTCGVKCPRLADEHHVCLIHSCQVCGQLTVKPGFCANHYPMDLPAQPSHVEQMSENYPCQFVSINGQSCQEKVTDDSNFCVLHRCQHGKKTFRGDYHCHNHVIEGQQFCDEHIHSCDYYWTEDDTGMPVCNEDIRPCNRHYVVTSPKRMCEFHYQLHLFEQASEYGESDDEPDSP